MVDVPDGADVDVGFGALVGGHECILPAPLNWRNWKLDSNGCEAYRENSPAYTGISCLRRQARRIVPQLLEMGYSNLMR